DCEDQAEVDYFWERLSEGGATSQCGWLKDKFGLSWQVAPRRSPEMLQDPDPARAKRAMAAMMQMTKLDIAALERAADGRSTIDPSPGERHDDSPTHSGRDAHGHPAYRL